MGAMPPLTQRRIDILLANGIKNEHIEFNGYKRLRLKPDGYCVLFHDGRCIVHSVKPETCMAGPFTFDVKGNILQIFIKKPSICPMVKVLKEDRDAYNGLFELATGKIIDLLKDLPPQELAEIVKIDEPETELVAEIDLRGKGIG
jgi:uncharacterized protein